ncbi:MAG: gluconokinase [Acidobacteria bacterium]|nr:gluconokinase [Acidobacteriota bacterium]MCA1641983.1 gluconokinase [Acidobacteriota bacterium]
MSPAAPDDSLTDASEARAPLVLAVDIGTSSARAALYDAAAREIAATNAHVKREFTATRDGGAEDEPEDLLADVLRVVDDAHARAAAGHLQIEAVAVSCFMHSLVGVDAGGRAVTPVYGWADTRAASEVPRLSELFDERAAHARTGCPFHASYWAAKLLWLRRAQPDAFARAARWLSFGEYLLAQLCGDTASSVSMASGTGLLDVRRCAWDEEIVAGLNITAGHLPRLAADAETFALSEDYGARWSLLRGRPIFAVEADGPANNVGAVCVTKREIALMIGTSGAMRVVYEGEPPGDLPASLWCYRLDRRRVAVGGALSDGGGLYEWMRETLALTGDGEQIEREIAAMQPRAHGLTVLPFWAGERSTRWNAHARGAIFGLRTHTRPAEIVRAALEAVALRFAAIASDLEAHAPGAQLYASGGALRHSRAWTQMIADATGRTVRLSRAREASSRGVVLLALENLGAIKNLTDAPPPVYETFTPDAEAHATYREALARQESLYKSVFDPRH